MFKVQESPSLGTQDTNWEFKSHQEQM